MSRAATAPLTIIVAMDSGRGIGIDNALPWHLPEDLAHFKRVTLGHPIIMGRKTFDSIGRPLPKRRNIVVTRDATWSHEGVEAAMSIADAIALVDGAPAFLIGGAQVFAQSLEQDLATAMIVTEIDGAYPCDTFFPALPAGWLETARERHQSADGTAYSFVHYQKAP